MSGLKAWMAAVFVATALSSGVVPSRAADRGLVSVRSNHSVADTTERLVRALEERSDLDWRVLEKIDHAAQAAKFGEQVLPRTTTVFAHMPSWIRYTNESPTLALELPPRILIWQDERGRVWLTYNSVPYWYRNVLYRHDVTTPVGSAEGFTWFLETIAREATK